MKKRIVRSFALGLLMFAVVLGISSQCPPVHWGSSLILAGCGWLVVSVAFFITNQSIHDQKR